MTFGPKLKGKIKRLQLLQELVLNITLIEGILISPAMLWQNQCWNPGVMDLKP